MSRQITIEVPEQVIRHASLVAARTSRRIEDILTAWLQQVTTECPVEELPDKEVLALTELRLTGEQEEALRTLLEQNRESILDVEDRHQLDDLMRAYELLLLRKSQALRVAVERGLRVPLTS
ncbi:MAG: hypothetical protein ACRD63_03240 [Pyrinomonadaceae bacterium]